MSYQYTNFIKELVEDEGKYFYMKKYYSVTTNPKESTIILDLKNEKELHTDIKRLVIRYSKANFETPLGRLEFFEAYNMADERAEGYYEDQVIAFFKNFGEGDD